MTKELFFLCIDGIATVFLLTLASLMVTNNTRSAIAFKVVPALLAIALGGRFLADLGVLK